MNKNEQLLKQIPALKKVPEVERTAVFKKTFKNNTYRFFLGLIVVLFILIFYFNLDNILQYKGLVRGGMIARSVNFLQELGASFFIPLMIVFLVLVLGRNYFVKLEVKKYLKNKN